MGPLNFVTLSAITLCLLLVPANGFLKPFMQWTGISQPDAHQARPRSSRQANRGKDSSLPPLLHGEKTNGIVKAEQQILNDMQKYSHSECWKEAVASLHTSCSKAIASDSRRSKLAIQFTQCQLEVDKRPEAAVLGECLGNKQRTTIRVEGEDSDTTIQFCISDLSSDLYKIYLEFSLHVEVMCYYIQEELFQQRAMESVNALGEASRGAHASLRDVIRKTDSVSSAVGAVQRAQEDVASNLGNLKAISEAAVLSQQAQREQLIRDTAELQRLGSSLEEFRKDQAMLSTSHREFMDWLVEKSSSQQRALEGIAKDVTMTSEQTTALRGDQSAASETMRLLKQTLESVAAEQGKSMEEATAVFQVLQQLHNFSIGPLKTHLHAIESASKSAALQQQTLFSATQQIIDGVEQVHAYQRRIAGAFFAIEAAVFYFTTILGGILLTMAPRLHDARFPVTLITMITLGVDITLSSRFPVKLAQMALLAGASSVSPAEAAALFALGGIGESGDQRQLLASLVSDGQWVLRKLSILFCVCVLARCAYKYRSPEQRQREMFREELGKMFKEANVMQGMKFLMDAASMYHADAVQQQMIEEGNFDADVTNFDDSSSTSETSNRKKRKK